MKNKNLNFLPYILFGTLVQLSIIIVGTKPTYARVNYAPIIVLTFIKSNAPARRPTVGV